MDQELIRKKAGRKRTVVLVVVVLIIAGLGYGYFWVQGVVKRDQTSRQVLESARQYDVVTDAIRAERQRCQEFIAQRTGNFGNFEYCKSFIDWTDRALQLP